MKSTWQHRWNRLFRRRGGLPRSARLPQTGYRSLPRTGAFARQRTGRFEVNVQGQRWLRRLVWGGLAVGAIWVLWQSWLGLGVYNN